MTRTLPALSALAITFSLLVFALLQRGAQQDPTTAGACPVDAPAVELAPVAPVVAEVASCGDETVVASAGAGR